GSRGADTARSLPQRCRAESTHPARQTARAATLVRQPAGEVVARGGFFRLQCVELAQQLGAVGDLLDARVVSGHHVGAGTFAVSRGDVEPLALCADLRQLLLGVALLLPPELLGSRAGVGCGCAGRVRRGSDVRAATGRLGSLGMMDDARGLRGIRARTGVLLIGVDHLAVWTLAAEQLGARRARERRDRE